MLNIRGKVGGIKDVIRVREKRMQLKLICVSHFAVHRVIQRGYEIVDVFTDAQL